MTAPLDSFETALLDRLREHVDPEQAHEPAATRPRRPRSWVLATAVGTTAAAAVVLLPAAVPSLLGGSTAYSVQEGNSGEIVVRVERLEDAEGLEADLAELGVRADVTYVPEAQQCAPGRYEPVTRSLSGLTLTMGSEVLEVRLPPGTVRPGETFVMALSGEQDGDTFHGWSEFDVTAGPVAPCEIVPSTTS